MSGKLYIVATPIGNLDDISARALETLKSADFILAEDTRVTKKLLDKYEIKKPMLTYNQHTYKNPDKLKPILARILSGESAALVTDAGTPGISDPGNELIEKILHPSIPSSNLEEGEPAVLAGGGGVRVIPIPGPSALTVALSVCGFDVSRFSFIGFMPKKKRNKLITKLLARKEAFVYFDSPHRVIKNLELIEQLGGKDRRVWVGRELTKMYEAHYRGNISNVVDMLKSSDTRGEVVVVVEKQV